MKPTLPAYRFRIRSRQSPAPSSHNKYVVPFSLISILVVLAIASPQVIPRHRIFSLVDLNATAHHLPNSNSSAPPSSFSALQQSLFGNAPTAPKQKTQNAPVSARNDPADRDHTSPSIGRRLHATSVQSPPSESPPSLFTPDQPSVATQKDVEQTPSSLFYDDLDTTGNEANIAYFIQISQETVAHLPRLINRIYHSNHTFLIHFDKKVDIPLTQRVQKNLYKRNPEYRDNVFYMTPELITYRGVSMLLNTINAMRQLLKLNAKWHYFINLSGADYPLVSQHTMRTLLGKHLKEPLNFLTYAPPDKWVMNKEYRMDHVYVDEALSFQTEPGVVHQLPIINPLAKKMRLVYANAEAWMINSRQFCKFVVTSGYARKLLLTFAYSVESSEHYFATLLWNHEYYNRTIVGHSMRAVVWEFEGRKAGQHPFYVDEQSPDGRFLLRRAVEDSPTFFVRKFKHADSALMDVVDERWTNESHLQKVREKLDWHVEISMKEHAVKSPVSSISGSQRGS